VAERSVGKRPRFPWSTGACHLAVSRTQTLPALSTGWTAQIATAELSFTTIPTRIPLKRARVVVTTSRADSAASGMEGSPRAAPRACRGTVLTIPDIHGSFNERAAIASCIRNVLEDVGLEPSSKGRLRNAQALPDDDGTSNHVSPRGPRRRGLPRPLTGKGFIKIRSRPFGAPGSSSSAPSISN
jgi:hypothetical protein